METLYYCSLTPSCRPRFFRCWSWLSASLDFTIQMQRGNIGTALTGIDHLRASDSTSVIIGYVVVAISRNPLSKRVDHGGPCCIQD